MKCLDEGQLLAYLEKQLTDSESIDVAGHLASCRICQRRLLVVQDEMAFFYLEMAPLLRQRDEAPVSGQHRVWETVKASPYLSSRRPGRIIKKAAIAAVLVIALGGWLALPTIQVVAENLLQVFRVGQVSTVILPIEDIKKVRSVLMNGNQEVDLEKFGRIKSSGNGPSMQRINNIQLPFAIKLPTPVGSPKLYLDNQPDIELTLQVANVNRLLKVWGSQDQLPIALDGKTFKLTLPLTVVARYADYELVQGASPEIIAPPGVDVEPIRQVVLNLPVWSPQVRWQLAAIKDWQQTLIVPGQEGFTRQLVVNGRPATFIENGGQDGGILLWEDQGQLFMLSLYHGPAEQAVEIAASLQEYKPAVQ